MQVPGAHFNFHILLTHSVVGTPLLKLSFYKNVGSSIFQLADSVYS